MEEKKKRKAKRKSVPDTLVDYCLSHAAESWKTGDLAEAAYSRETPGTLKNVKSVFSLVRTKLLDEHKRLVLALKDKGKVTSYRFATPDDGELVAEFMTKAGRATDRKKDRTLQIFGVVEQTGLLPAERCRQLRGEFTALAAA
jgi:hypothetical protein